MKPFRMTARRWFWTLLAAVLLWLILATRFFDRGKPAPNLGAGDNLKATLIVAAPAGWVQDRFDRLAHPSPNDAGTAESIRSLREENVRLNSQVTILASQLAEVAQRLKENGLLIRIESLQNHPQIPANIIQWSASPVVDTCLIDRGSFDKLVVGALVEVPFTPVGRVISVGGKTSTVRLVTDRSSLINARVKRKNASGSETTIVDLCQVRGAGNGMLECDTIVVAGTIEPKVGDFLVVADHDWQALQGWPIGDVVEVSRYEAQRLRYDLKIRPRVQITTHTDVWVALP